MYRVFAPIIAVAIALGPSSQSANAGLIDDVFDTVVAVAKVPVCTIRIIIEDEVPKDCK